METRQNGFRWPDGVSFSWTPSLPRIGMVGIGGTYYRNPGSDTAPSVTLTGMYGRGRDVWKFGPPLASFNGGLVYRRDGMTSADTLGYGTTSNASTVLPSVTVNTSIPDINGIPQLGKNKVSSIEAGLSTSVGASRATTYTVTPRQISDFISKSFVTPAMGPNDELSPFARTLRSGVGTVGAPSEPPVRYVSSPYLNSLGKGMGDWRSSTEPIDSRSPAPPPSPQEPGGLYGLMLDYLRNH
jgi:hypothetical protein